jgi:hypothetical protein
MTLQSKVLILFLIVGRYFAVVRTIKHVKHHDSFLFGSRIPKLSTDCAGAKHGFAVNHLRHVKSNDQGGRYLEDGEVSRNNLRFHGKAVSQDENQHANLFLGQLTRYTNSTILPLANNSFLTITAAPSEACSAALDASNQCMRNSFSNSSCKDCINVLFQNFNASLTFKNATCSLFQSPLCSNIIRCGCEKCQYELEKAFYGCFVQDHCAVMDCANSTSETDVPTYSIPPLLPNSSMCQDAFLTAQACAVTMGSCPNCIYDALDTIVQDHKFTCEEFSDGMCSAIVKDCDCGFCREYLQAVSSFSILKHLIGNSLLSACFHDSAIFSISGEHSNESFLPRSGE